MDEIWSNTDFPYMCLKDEKRTIAFRKAIHSIIKKGDIVIDVGSGTGILSFFAAEAGAKKVYAVEIEHMLSTQLRKSIRLNKLDKIIEVVEGDANNIKLPRGVDVVISELIETGLFDESQVPTLNTLRKKAVINSNTHIIPYSYKTYLQLVYTDNLYYGYEIVAPKHEWPFYSFPHTGWIPTKISPVSEPVELIAVDFTAGIIQENISKVLNFPLKGRKANAIKLSGHVFLTPEIILGPTNGLNGDKILPMNLVQNKEMLILQVTGRMGSGLGKLKFEIDKN